MCASQYRRAMMPRPSMPPHVCPEDGARSPGTGSSLEVEADPMTKARQTFGRLAEDMAAKALRRRGYRILERNYRNPLGEIDIIARDGDALVFVEVKARRSLRFGRAKAAVNALKQKQIARVAIWYLKVTDQMGAKARFDVVAIDRSAPETDGIEIIQNAFTLPG
jgi:putative endonuclease